MSSRAEAIAALEGVIARAFPDGVPLRVLEAGCGSATHLRLPSGSRVTGLDVSRHQLDRNPALHDRLHGDLQSFTLSPGAFDLIVCWEVLEHLPRPAAAFDNLARALAPGGFLVVALPNVLSVKGLVTKLTPHWFHVAFYRHIYGVAEAGRPDEAPFPTFLRLSTTAAALDRAAAAHGLHPVFRATHDVRAYLRERHRLASRVYEVVDAVGRRVTAGRLGDSDFIVAYRRD